LIAFLEGFEHAKALLVGQAVGAPAIKDKELNTGEFVDEPREPAIEASGGHFLKEAPHAGIGNGLVQAGGLMGEGTGQPGLSGSGLAGEDDLFMGLELAALGERLDLAAIKATGGREVDVFDAGVGEAHLCIPESVGEPFVGAPCGLAIEHEAEPFIAVQGFAGILLGQGAPCGGHAVQAETGHLLEGGMCQHCPYFLHVYW
jgi:hypothetical protein